MEKNKTNIELAIELIQRVHEISSKHNEPIDNLFRDALTEYLSKTSEKGIEEVLFTLSEEILDIHRVLASYAFYYYKKKERELTYQFAQEKETIKTEFSNPKKQVYSATEAIDIANKLKIKGKMSKNTIYSHLRGGILKGKQDDLGNWTIKRVDLEEYFRTDSF